MAQLLWKTFWWFLTKLNVHLPYDAGAGGEGDDRG